MKNRFPLLAILFFLAMTTFAQKAENSNIASLISNEIAFSKTATEKGIRDSFLDYIAEDAVLFRPNLVPGKKWLLDHPKQPGLLTWRPIFADASEAGDLGYTTGPWEFRENGPEDKEVYYGNFISVWKKQADGTWKFVVDQGIDNPKPPTEVTLQLAAKAQEKTRHSKGNVNLANERAAVLNTDKIFSKDSSAKGIGKAYLEHISEDSRVFRDKFQPMVGKAAIQKALAEKADLMTSVSSGGDVSASGDLGYTYGTYEVKSDEKKGAATESGIYLRIWKKQSKGNWKLVLDVIKANPPAKPKQ